MRFPGELPLLPCTTLTFAALHNPHTFAALHNAYICCPAPGPSNPRRSWRRAPTHPSLTPPALTLARPRSSLATLRSFSCWAAPPPPLALRWLHRQPAPACPLLRWGLWRRHLPLKWRQHRLAHELWMSSASVPKARARHLHDSNSDSLPRLHSSRGKGMPLSLSLSTL